MGGICNTHDEKRKYIRNDRACEKIFCLQQDTVYQYKLFTTYEVLNDERGWQCVLFHKCRYHQVAFRSAYKGDKGMQGERGKKIVNVEGKK